MPDIYQQSVELHRKNKGKLGVHATVEVKDKTDLSLVYTPGVAQVCREVAKNPEESFNLTWRGRTVAVISDGSAVLGLGNIGPEAAMPVMEGKALLFKQFGGVDGIPLCIDLHTADKIVDFVKAVAPSFGGINLEDITSPLCIEVEDRLQDIGIPVMHDDQHGTAMVVSAALMNSAKVVGKRYEDLKVVISGAGSAGLAIAQMLLSIKRESNHKSQILQFSNGTRVKDVVILDSKGIINEQSESWKGVFAQFTNKEQITGDLAAAMVGADAFVGVSKGGIVSRAMVATMAKDAIVLAMANPDPEILPDEAKAGGAAIVGTGRSDYPNQANNSLIFPGFFRGLLDSKAIKVTTGMKQAARDALAGFIEPTVDKILPSMFDPGQAEAVARAVSEQVYKEGLGRV
ncbi:MAG: Malate dehydrogenase (Oxaloacetate-decarboxylating) [Microgenomates group bacterium GW2011_GWC2_46_7]|nr:MAG: Malate dehydrogenase (Oxaloacetate-decarboxylating) [Microgenomates group bacterium GW2011_GWC2_46_7]